MSSSNVSGNGVFDIEMIVAIPQLDLKVYLTD